MTTVSGMSVNMASLPGKLLSSYLLIGIVPVYVMTEQSRNVQMVLDRGVGRSTSQQSNRSHLVPAASLELWRTIIAYARCEDKYDKLFVESEIW